MSNTFCNNFNVWIVYMLILSLKCYWVNRKGERFIISRHKMLEILVQKAEKKHSKLNYRNLLHVKGIYAVPKVQWASLVRTKIIRSDQKVAEFWRHFTYSPSNLLFRLSGWHSLWGKFNSFYSLTCWEKRRRVTYDCLVDYLLATFKCQLILINSWERNRERNAQFLSDQMRI